MEARPFSDDWLTREDRALLDARAAEQGRAPADVLRDALRQYLQAPASTGEQVRISVQLLDTLKSSQEIFHEFMEDTEDLLLRVDAEGRITYVNRAAETFFGLPPQSCIGLPASQFVHPDDRDRLNAEFTACFQGHVADCTFENRLVSLNGDVRDVLWSTHAHLDREGRIATLTSIARDISARKRADELHERNQRALLDLAKQKAFSGGNLNEALQVITEVAAHTLNVERVGVWLFRDNYSRIQCVNLYTRSTNQHAIGAELTATDAPVYFEALEQDRVIAADDAPNDPHTRELAAYLEAGRIGAMLDAPVHTDGKTTGVICHEHLGGPRAWTLDEQSFVASIGDMVSMAIEQSERKRVELEMLRQTIELEKATELSRMKSEFINTVAHELRTPLTSVVGLLEFLEDGVGGTLNPEQLDYVRQILSNLQRLTRLVDDLMDLARLQVGTFQLAIQETDLGLLVADNLSSLQPQAQAGEITLAGELPETPIVAQADPMRLSQVLANLVTNAIKFTPAGGRITVRLHHGGDHARIEVADTGRAIAPEDIPKLFQRFSQLEGAQAKGGLGLGLAISKGLVDAHGGQIGVDSVMGQGSTFWFTVPFAPPAAATITPAVP
jgi:PAS domain S-box-containing protein